MHDAQIDLRSGAMVETKQPAEPLGAFDGARSGFGANGRLDQPIIEPSRDSFRARRRRLANTRRPELLIDRADCTPQMVWLQMRVTLGHHRGGVTQDVLDLVQRDTVLHHPSCCRVADGVVFHYCIVPISRSLT